MKGQMMNWEDCLDANQSQFVDDLLEFVRIPSVSASKNHVEDVVTARNWVVQRPIAAGVENVRMMATEGHPVV